MPDRRQLLPFLSFGFLVFSLIFTTALVQMRQIIEKKAAGDDLVAVLELEVTGGNSFEASPGDTFDVKLNLKPNSGDGLSAVDVVLDFDHGRLVLEDIVPNTGGNLMAFAPRTADGTDFDTAAVMAAANTGGETEGVIRFGAVAFDYSAAGGEGDVTVPQVFDLSPLATLTFRVKDIGQGGTAEIRFDWREDNPGTPDVDESTIESNAVRWVEPGSDEAVVDILVQPTTAVEATITLSISLLASLIPEHIASIALTLPVQVTITKVGEADPAFDQLVTFSRTDPADPFVSDSFSFEGDSGTYGIRVKGPLHLSQAATGVIFVAGENTLVDFSSGGTEKMLGGDLDGTNEVDMADVGVLLTKYDTTSPEADINFDGEVDMQDVGFLINNYGKMGEE